jgi:thiol-disulfide isomerase/thioredoxin
MPKTKKTKKVSKDVDIETEADLPKLKAAMKNAPVMLVFIHADWCGHCQTFKPNWKEYKSTPGRNIPMVSVNEKVLSKSPFSNAKIDGYPSNIIYSPKDGSLASFKKENGEETHSVPNIRDKAAMTKLLKANPNQLMANNGMSTTAAIDSESLEPTPDMRNKLTESGKKAIEQINTPAKMTNDPGPPNTADDRMAPSNEIPTKVSGGGGNLFQSIVRAIKGLGRPTRRSKRRGTRKSVTL